MMKRTDKHHCNHECVCSHYHDIKRKPCCLKLGECEDDTRANTIVYSYKVNVPSKAFPCIKRRKLALNDIGDDEDGFTRMDFELQNGDVIQVVRGVK